MTQPGTPIVQLSVGDTAPLGSVLANIHMMGVVTDPTTPNMLAATLEVLGDQGVLTVPVLQGPPGPAGQPQFALRFQNDPTITSTAQLPTNLTATDADIGRYWIIKNIDANGNVTGTTAYIWYGTQFMQLPMGSQGPPGPYPIITPTVNLLDPTQSSYIEVSGPSSNPQWMLHLAVPSGPPGPAGGWNRFDSSIAPQTGQVVGFNGRYDGAGNPVYEPMFIGDIMPKPYTVPESAFQSLSGVTSGNQTVCTWQAPAQQWPWQPFIWGQMDIFGAGFGVLLSDLGLAGPTSVGAEVRLNDPSTGPVIALGMDSSHGTVVLIPHASSAANPSTAMTPGNYAQVAAGVSPTIYVNLLNNGLLSSYNYNPANSQLAMLAIPVGTERALPTAYFATFSARSSFSATWHA